MQCGWKTWKSDGNWAGKDPAVGCQGHREGGKTHWSHFRKQITPSSHLGGELPKEMTEWKSWKEAMCPNPLSYTERNWGWGQRLNDLSRASQVALVVKNLPANAGDTRDVSSIPGLGRSPGVVNGNLLQYSGLKNPWTEEHGGLQSEGPQRVRYDWAQGLAGPHSVRDCAPSSIWILKP